jgi:hypothetical protein
LKEQVADVAQLVEQLIRNQQVVSSSLTVGSIDSTLHEIPQTYRVNIIRVMVGVLGEGFLVVGMEYFPPERGLKFEERRDMPSAAG